MPTINTNVAAIKARRNLDKVQRELDTSIAVYLRVNVLRVLMMTQRAWL
jgi:hypothetical protein